MRSKTENERNYVARAYCVRPPVVVLPVAWGLTVEVGSTGR